MLGRLFSSAASSLNHSSSTSRSKHSPESVQEDIHTRSLLFPDASQLQQPQTHLFPLPNGSTSSIAGSHNTFDYYGELDLESPRDCRIIVAQDSSASQPEKCVLFDSKPVPSAPERHGETSRASSRGESGEEKRPRSSGSTPSELPMLRKRGSAGPADTPQSSAFGAFQRASRRPPTTSPETLPNKHRNELKTYLDCMFGNAPLAYKGPSTKFHVMPLENRPDSKSSETGFSVIFEGSSSVGHSDGRRKSLLAQSYTPNNPPDDFSSANPTLLETNRASQKRVVLITRMFSVPLSGSQFVISDGESQNTPRAGHPFPHSSTNGDVEQGNVKQVKTPMFAVCMVITLPAAKSAAASAKSGPSSFTGSRLNGSYHGHGSYSSSLDVDKKLGYSDTHGAPDMLSISGGMTGDGDDAMDVIAQRWDVISRILGTLQRAAEAEILKQLREAEISLSQALQSSRSTGSTETRKPYSRANQQTIQLPSRSLMNLPKFATNIENIENRAILALRIPRVTTGQGRWGVWREEARWVGRWAIGKQQNEFLYAVLSGFLATHHDWLDIIGPRSYRRLSRQIKQSSTDDDQVLSERTIVVSNDKMTARRLVFLLSAFLPASHFASEDSPNRRPITSASLRGYSQSPPSGFVPREESQRRFGSRQRGVRGSSRGHVRTMSFPAHPNIDENNWDEDVQHSREGGGGELSQRVIAIDELGLRKFGRSSSRGEETSRKSSVATTSTATPSALSAHITRMQETTKELSLDHRRGSNGSLASMNLMQTLRRNDTRESTASAESRPASRWGSLMSGLWSARRDSSTDNSDLTTGSDGKILSSPRPKEADSGNGVLSDMVNEAEQLRKSIQSSRKPPKTSQIEASILPPSPDGSGHLEVSDAEYLETSSRAIPPRARTTESPLKFSVDEKDGIIDVDIGLPFLGSSSSPFSNSPFSSPSTRGYLHSLDHLRCSSSPHSTLTSFSSICPFATTDSTSRAANVAAYLPRFHPDFTLQALPSYLDLEADVHAALAAEPIPTFVSQAPGSWHTTSTALLVNTTKSTLTRIRLERRLCVPTSSIDTAVYESRIIKDSDLAPDPALSATLDCILATSGSSTPASRSRSTSRPTNSAPLSSTPDTSGATDPRAQLNEVPRGECKRALLSSLEEIVMSVVREAEDASTAAIKRDLAAKLADDNCLRQGVKEWILDLRAGMAGSGTVARNADVHAL